ncbi:MAG TPA: hypothetical protein VMG31_09630 [Verrucomicrobiae bacterium]|nr:hypothetical protein [Verrucomicrobiae bacterium]
MMWRKAFGSTRLLPLLGALVAFGPAAFAQADFTIQAAAFSPGAVNPGGSSASTITINTLNGFNNSVDFTCDISPQTTSVPTCTISPPSVTPPATAAATITTTGLSTPGLYTVTITGTASGTTNSHSTQQNLSVLAVTPQFTVTVAAAVAPSSVHAGSGAQGTISVNPISGYSGTVTLSCASITPLVTIPPQCSFNPQPLTVSGVPATSTISVTTIGPTTIDSLPHINQVYGLWLSLPIFGLVGIGAILGGKRSRAAWSLFGLFILSGFLLLIPACSTTTTFTSTNTNVNGITPKNTYVFTLMGVDANGNTSSNTGTSNTAPTVTLTVN